MESARYKAFLAAVETGSFSRAAEQLNYTPSGVSQLVTALENELNVTLLHRTKKGVSLTNDGKHFVPVVRSLVGEENRLYELASQVNGLLIGSISIATYSSVAVYWLPKIIRRFRETYPQIQFKFHEGTWQELSRQLDDRRADLAFFSHRDPMPYDWIPLAEIPLLAILPRSHPLAGAGVFPIQQYRRETLIIPDLKQVSDIYDFLNRHQLTPDESVLTADDLSAMALIEQGMGVGILNALIASSETFDVARLPLDPPESITLGMAALSFRHASPAVQKFVECVKEMGDL